MRMLTKNKAGQPSVAGIIIAAVCIIIYLFALVQAAVRLYLSVDQRRNTAEREFAYITDLALSAGSQGFMDDRFVDAINNALAASRSIEALIISGPDGEYAFERQKGRAVTWINNSPRFINRFSFSGQSLYKTLPINNLRNVTIRAVAGALDYGEFAKILKDTLLLILIGFALSFFTLLLQMLINGKPEEVIVRPPEYKPVKQKPAQSENEEEIIETAPVPVQRAEQSGPKGLYSPRSNIGWEEYTRDRLDSELHRCASTEKDLTLVLLEFEDEINDALFKVASEEAVTFFTTRDLLFEHGERGIAAIIPGVDLETSLEKARKFHQRIKERIFFNQSSADSLSIGLSSRAGRLLEADRILMEAAQALKKASDDRDTSIIAFKSNPEKYREFIRNRG